MVYKTQRIVANYECDENDKMQIGASLRCMQDVASLQLEHLGQGYERLLNDHNMVFLLAKTCLKVHRRPMCDEIITLATCPTKGKGARFNRDVVIYDKEDNPLISILTVWMLVDVTDRKILRPNAYPYPLPAANSIVGNDIQEERLPRISTEMQPIYSKTQPVEYSHIDNNGHVNNSVYMDFMANLLPYEVMVNNEIDKVIIAYENEAVPGNIINIDCYKEAENSALFSGTKAGESCFSGRIVFKD